jgi:hypothetical protein
MYLVAERNDIGLGHGIFLLTNSFVTAAVRFFPAALLTKASWAQSVMSETDAVRADAIGNYVEFVVAIWDVSCRETD